MNRALRSLSAVVAQARRDVAVVTGRLQGRGLAPVVPRRRSDAAGARHNARALRVERVVRETADAVTLVLRDGEGGAFSFLPGQFFTVLAEVDGEIVPRNYSASNAPGQSELHLTIKRKHGGRVSGALTRTAPGDVLRVLGPFGSFVVDAPSPATGPRRFVLVAGGAGITPLASIARSVLACEPDAEMALVVANRRREDVIFAPELEALQVAYGARLSLVHVLEDGAGRLDRATCACVLDALPLAAHPQARFYVCGPDGMRDEVLASLAARGVDEAAIFVERFAIGPRPHAAPSAPRTAPRLTLAAASSSVAIVVEGRTHRGRALPGASVLEAGLAAGAPMPFSCGVGGCGACRVKVLDGQVEMDEPNCLAERERALGYVLACVARPCGPCTVEVTRES